MADRRAHVTALAPHVTQSDLGREGGKEGLEFVRPKNVLISGQPTTLGPGFDRSGREGGI